METTKRLDILELAASRFNRIAQEIDPSFTVVYEDHCLILCKRYRLNDLQVREYIDDDRYQELEDWFTETVKNMSQYWRGHGRIDGSEGSL